MPELEAYSGLTRRPIFVPSVGNFRAGMLVSIPLHLDTLPGTPMPADLHAALAARYAGSEFISVIPTLDGKDRLAAEALANTDQLELRVFGTTGTALPPAHAVLVARLDNLGKGAAGAAIQNLKLMLGLTS